MDPGFLKNIHGVNSAVQGDPDHHPAPGPGEPGVGREVVGNGNGHGRGLVLDLVSQPFQMTVIGSGFQKPGNHALVDARAGELGIEFDPADLVSESARNGPSGPESRGHGF